MTFGAGSALDYLLSRGLVKEAVIAAGDLSVTETRSLNTSFRVVSRKGPCYLLKHGGAGVGSSRLAIEASAYACLAGQEPAMLLSRFVPRFYAYAPGLDLLTLELFPDAETLLDYHLRTGRFPVGFARQMAEALSTLHSLQIGRPAGGHVPLPTDPPWALAIHHPGFEMLAKMNNANTRFISIIQRHPPFEELLDGLREEWHAECMVHGDLKWANCLLHSPGSRTGTMPEGRHITTNTLLKIVDWEFAALGDPCWDIGSVFADYLNLWLRSIPVGEQGSMHGGVDPGGLPALARFPLETMQTAIQAFWEHYCLRSGIDAHVGFVWLARSMRYAAARLLQLGYEQNQIAPTLPSNMLLLLQLSLNMLQRPLEAAAQLLNIAAWSSVPDGSGGRGIS
jgi:hypothetical protein